MSRAPIGTDFQNNPNIPGGSEKGRDLRRAPLALKLATHRWAISELADGVEHLFGHSPVPFPRFSARQYENVVPLLAHHFPDEALAYFGGREERAANIIMNRIHKMYWSDEQPASLRGYGTREHPTFWKPSDRAAAYARLNEAGWPW